MHPWKNIISGKIEELETKSCFICLARIQCSDGDMEEVKQHLINVHSASAKDHLEELLKMCIEAEEKEEKEGWSIDETLEEVRDRREAQEKKRAESGGLMVMFRKKKIPECLDNNDEAENDEVDCFLCQEIVKRCEYNKHLEKQHGVIFGAKEIMKAGEKSQSSPINEEQPKIRTDADTVKELVGDEVLSSDWDWGPGTCDLRPGTWEMGNGNREYPQSQEMTVKSHRPSPTHPSTPQLLTMKEEGRTKKYL